MPAKRSRRPPVTTLVRRWSAVVVIATVGYFYYHPLQAYFSTRSELGTTRTEVAQLAAQKRDLTRRLAASSSLDALARAAPFPTMYWVTCRHLVAQVSRLEADGGVDRWTRAARDNAVLATSLERANDEQRRLRPELDAGIAGARSTGGSLKCLHAHIAFALARPGYELGEGILEELGPLWPRACCSE